MKPRVREVIVVEGRYDRNTLLQVVDATVVEVGGFALFNDREKAAYLRRLAEARGVILLTDPDGAGFVLRSHLKGLLPPDRVKQAYVPDVYGKEKRKRKPGKEGKLGVEGMTPQVLTDALRRARCHLRGGGRTPPLRRYYEGGSSGQGTDRPRLRRKAGNAAKGAGSARTADRQRASGGVGSPADPGGI